MRSKASLGSSREVAQGCGVSFVNCLYLVPLIIDQNFCATFTATNQTGAYARAPLLTCCARGAWIFTGSLCNFFLLLYIYTTCTILRLHHFWALYSTICSWKPIATCFFNRRSGAYATLAVFSCEKDAKNIYEKHCSTFRFYVVNIILPYAN